MLASSACPTELWQCNVYSWCFYYKNYGDIIDWFFFYNYFLVLASDCYAAHFLTMLATSPKQANWKSHMKYGSNKAKTNTSQSLFMRTRFQQFQSYLFLETINLRNVQFWFANAFNFVLRLPARILTIIYLLFLFLFLPVMSKIRFMIFELRRCIFPILKKILPRHSNKLCVLSWNDCNIKFSIFSFLFKAYCETPNQSTSKSD